MLVTPFPVIPHGIMTEVSKNESSDDTLMAKPCVVIHLDAETPTAAILLFSTNTPILLKIGC